MAEENVTEQHRTLGALLRLPYEALSKRVYGRLAEAGYDDVRIAHSSVFRHILPGGSRVTALAERAQITKQSMGYLVDALAAGGYLKIEPDPSDGRAKLVRLTARGQRVQAMLLRLSAEVEQEFLPLLGEKKFAQLKSLLQEWVDALARQSSP